MTRFRAMFTGFPVLLLLIGSLLGVPAVSAQQGQGSGNTPKICLEGDPGSASPTIEGIATAYETTRDCASTSASGQEGRSAYFTAKLLPQRTAVFHGGGLMPDAPLTFTHVMENGTMQVTNPEWAVVTQGGTVNYRVLAMHCDPDRPEINLAILMITTQTIGGTSISATVEFPHCSDV